MKEDCHGFYATHLHLPCSSVSRRIRALSRRLRGKGSRSMQETKLAQVRWLSVPGRGRPRIWDGEQIDGNVKWSELAILAALAAGVPDGSPIFEIGSFDARTTLHLTLSSQRRSRVFTLGPQAGQTTAFSLAAGERHMIEKPRPGQRYEKARMRYPAAVARIHQLLGDSATFDFTPYWETCGMVFVDGSHAYDYVMTDSRAAIRLARRGGVVVWHDYGVWEGVTKALEELDERRQLGLRHIRGTSLVYWRRP